MMHTKHLNPEQIQFWHDMVHYGAVALFPTPLKSVA